MKLRGRYLRLVLVLLMLSTALVLVAGCNDLPYQEPVAGTACRFDFTSTADGLNLPASIYLPNGYDSSKSYPVWVELHALYALPNINNNPGNPFSTELKRLADTNGFIIVAPWGRNLHSMYVDGINKDSGTNAEPDIIDGMSSLTNWSPAGGHWTTESGGVIRQSDQTGIWKELVRTGSSGADYSIRVRAREIGRSGDLSAFGVNFRHTANGEFYHVDLCTDTSSGTTHKYVRMFRYVQGQWNLMYQVENDWNPLAAGDSWMNLKVTDYAGYIEVYVNDQIINMQPDYDSTPYGYGRFAPDLPTSGTVSVASLGGAHEFDEVRVQNEYEYGESDVMDCLGQAAEKYNLDENRIYLAGHSMGGLGAYILGLHNPGVFAAASASDGLSDLIYDYQFLKDYFPRNPGSPYADVNDGQITDYLRTINGTENTPDLSVDSALMKDNSARYILENAANLPYHIVHGTMDATIPNSHQTVNISWWAPWFFLWGQVQAPAPYAQATPTYANGKDIYDLLTSWSSTGLYNGDYVTNAYAGHGFMEPYADTVAYLTGRTLMRYPTQVAYKTYDDPESTSYWMKMKRYSAAGAEAGMVRASYDKTANKVSAHARNVEQLSLDLKRMGLDCGAGKTITVNLDADVSPVNMPVNDVYKQTTLNLTHTWPNPAGVTVKLDGTTLVSGTGYTWQNQTLTVPGIPLTSAHVLTIVSPSTVAANLLSNPGFETTNSDGSVTGWTSTLETGGSARCERNVMQSHAGDASLRIKDPAPGGSSYLANWNSQTVSGIKAGKNYALSVFVKTRMLKGAAVRMQITWLNSSGGTISVSTSSSLSDSGYSNLDWSQLYLKALAPTGAVSAKVKLQTVGSSAGAGTGSVFFDDASLFELP